MFSMLVFRAINHVQDFHSAVLIKRKQKNVFSKLSEWEGHGNCLLC